MVVRAAPTCEIVKMPKPQNSSLDITPVIERTVKVKKSRLPRQDQENAHIFQDDELLPRYDFRQEHEKVIRFLLLNPMIDKILDRMGALGLDDWWLSSGCLFQTIWNLRLSRPVTSGISDYDVIYYSKDLSWEAENDVIRRCAELFEDLPVHIEIRNQARVHLWYKDKFGLQYSPLKSATHSLWRYPSRTSALAITKDIDTSYKFYAPFGVEHALAMRVVPNRRTKIKNVYNVKAKRWLSEWPSLRVDHWDI